MGKSGLIQTKTVRICPESKQLTMHRINEATDTDLKVKGEGATGLVSQIVILHKKYRSRFLPYAFTEPDNLSKFKKNQITIIGKAIILLM